MKNINLVLLPLVVPHFSSLVHPTHCDQIDFLNKLDFITLKNPTTNRVKSQLLRKVYRILEELLPSHLFSSSPSLSHVPSFQPPRPHSPVPLSYRCPSAWGVLSLAQCS